MALPNFDTLEEVKPDALPDFKSLKPIEDSQLPDISSLRLTPYEEADLASMSADRGKPETGMEAGTGLTTALARGIPRDLAGAKAAAGDALASLADIPPNLYNRLKGFTPDSKGYVAPIGKELISDAAIAAVKPFVPIPKFESKPEDSFIKSSAKEAANMLLSIPEFIETPLGAATVGIGGAIKAAATPIRYAFASDMLGSMFQQAPELYQNWGKMTPGEKGKAITQFLGTGAMAALLTHPEWSSKDRPPSAQGPPATGEFLQTPEGAVPPPSKGDINAVPIRKPAQIPLEEPAANSPEVGQGISQPEKPADAQGQAAPDIPAQSAPVTPQEAKEQSIIARIKQGIKPENVWVSIGKDPAVPQASYVQVDELPHTDESLTSTNPNTMRKHGFEMPDTDTLLKLPQGQYSLPQALELLKKQEGNKPVASSETTPEPSVPTSDTDLPGPVKPRLSYGEKYVQDHGLEAAQKRVDKLDSRISEEHSNGNSHTLNLIDEADNIRKAIDKTKPTSEEVSNQPQEPPNPQGIAASVRNKWTTATEVPLGSESGFVNLEPIRELWEKAMPAVKASIDAIKSAYSENMNPAKTSDYRRAILNWSSKLQRSFGEASAAQKEIRSVVKDPSKRDGITNWMQAGGDPAILRQRLATTIAWRDPITGQPHPQSKSLIAGYEAALSLSPEEIAIANDARHAYDTLGARGTAYDVLNSFKQNYVTQIWDLNKGAAAGGSRTLKEKFRFSKASTFPTFFDGEQAGYVPKTKDISKLLPVYLHEMNAVIAARQLVEQMSAGKASDGRPLIAANGKGLAVDNGTSKATLVLPDAIKPDFKDYKSLENQPALHDWRWQTLDSDGKPVFMKADLALHPEAYSKFKNVLGKSAIKEWYDSKTSASASIPKALVKGLDMFQSQTKRVMLGVLTPFHQVQEGTHAIGHRINPFFNNPTIDLVHNAAQMDAARHGLMLLPDQASEHQFMEGFRQAGVVSRIPGLGPLADHYSNYLFHEYIPGIKLKTYEAILDRNTKVYSNELKAGRVTPEDVKILSASQANAAYGHLNYADLARNPTILHIMRLGLLAPDFLEARFRFSGQAIKGITGAKIGREQIIALASLAIAQATLSYVSAKLTGGEWDAKDPFSFHVGNRKFTMRSVPEDSLRLMNDTRAFVYARLNPIIGRGAVQYLSGRDWRGQKVKPGETTAQLLQQPIPLALRPLFGVGNSPLSGWEQLAGAAGLKITRYSAQSEIRNLAHEWMGKSLDPKIKAAELRYEKETLPDSDYKPLREALINNDFKTAKELYDKLLETRSPDRVTSVFNNPRPFSGSNEREAKFKSSLTEEQRKLYEQAKQEQRELKTRFSRMRTSK